MGSKEFSRAVRGSGTQPLATTQVEAFEIDNYDNGGSISVSSYPTTINPSADIQELIITSTGSDITMDITTTTGNTITGVPLNGASIALDTLSVDSVTLNDPNATGATTDGMWVGE